MKVGILGSGQVAQVLGAGFASHGHEVMLGTRDAAKLEEWAGENRRRPGRRRSPTRRPSATCWCWRSRAPRPRTSFGRPAPTNLAGKPVIDTTNPHRRRAAR